MAGSYAYRTEKDRINYIKEVYETECLPLLQIREAYPKKVIARTRHSKYAYEGIEIYNIDDWILLEEENGKKQPADACDGPDFPAEYLPLVKVQANALANLRQRNDAAWTFISPAGDFQTEGGRTGAYILASEELAPNERGESVISYVDYVIDMQNYPELFMER